MAEVSWDLIDEAVRSGKMTLEDGETVYRLNGELFVRLIQWLATSKAKKPQIVSKPEDFNLEETTGD